jgi:hypothetical protein
LQLHGSFCNGHRRHFGTVSGTSNGIDIGNFSM